MRSRSSFWLWAALITGVVVITIASTNIYVYMKFIRPWHLRWGATDLEVERAMPGDGVVVEPSFDATRAVTIDASPEDIYPWIVQMGLGRAGWHNYDWVDNIDPGRRRGFRVRGFVPHEWVLWGDREGTITWCWGLYPIDERSTRLVARARVKYDWMHPSIFFNMVFDVGDIVMMRRCLIGIRERAEIQARSPESRLPMR